MHIWEGTLSVTPHGQAVLIAGAAAGALGTAIGLSKMDYQRIPQVAVLSSAFFVASSIQVPLPPSSVHLMLTGLMGLVLGWAAFPAVLVALVLQGIFVSVVLGGPTTLGLNTVVMALPAVAMYYLFYYPVRSSRQTIVFLSGFAAGATAILLSALLAWTALTLSGKEFVPVAHALVLGHLPVALIEGLVTGSVVVLLRKVRPEVLAAPLLAAFPQKI
jgi:cobalt/nickel transport system permease protein